MTAPFDLKVIPREILWAYSLPKDVEGPHQKAHHCYDSLSGEAAAHHRLLGSKVDSSIIQQFHSCENTLRGLCTDPQEGGGTIVCSRKKLDATRVPGIRGMGMYVMENHA